MARLADDPRIHICLACGMTMMLEYRMHRGRMVYVWWCPSCRRQIPTEYEE